MIEIIDKKNFISKDYGWELLNSGKFFWDKQVAIFITTKTDSDHPDKEIFNEQLETLSIIYPAWEELSAIIEQEILAYEGKSKAELLTVIDSPKIWLDMDFNSNLPLSSMEFCIRCNRK